MIPHQFAGIALAMHFQPEVPPTIISGILKVG